MAHVIAFAARSGMISRISAFFAVVVDIIRETREMHATFGSKYGE